MTHLESLIAKAKAAPKDAMLRDGRLIYSVAHYGWSKGVEQFCNRLTMDVQAAYGKATEDEADALADFHEAATPHLILALCELAMAAEEVEIRGDPCMGGGYHPGSLRVYMNQSEKLENLRAKLAAVRGVEL